MQPNRRQFLQLTAGLGLTSVIPKVAFALAQKPGQSQNPIQSISSLLPQSFDFNGDNIDKPHEGLWNPDGVAGKAGGWPEPSESQDLVIIGGGISGLLSAYSFIDQKPLILELDRQFGGNSKGEVYKKTTYSLGAAYVTVPEKGSSIDLFFKELGLDQLYRHEEDDEVHFFHKNKRMSDFWNGVTDPEKAKDFQRVFQELQRIYDEAYPDIPWSPDSALSEKEFHQLDDMSFEQWLLKTFGEVHPHILEYFELYAWSSFTACISEISAAQMLNFVVSELDGVLAFPGGNSAISQKLFDHLRKKLDASKFRSECLVIRLKVNPEGVLVYYMDPKNELRAIQTKKVIMACQKFIAKKVCVDMPESQKQAIDSMQYRGYIVGNAIYGQSIPSPGFDLYCYEGERPEEPRAMTPPKRNFTDIVMANWANNDKSDDCILTVYRPLPFDGARQFLFNPNAHDKHYKILHEGLVHFEKELGLQRGTLKAIRMTRWGHSLPVAATGFISSGLQKKVNAPIENKIFFANQDNWANPAFESAFAAVESLRDSGGFF